MKIERKQLEILADALKLTEAEVFEVRLDNGKLLLYEVQTVEKLKAVPVTPQGIAQRRRASVR